MNGGADIGRMLVVLGVVVVIVGLVMIFADRIPFLGRLPGDIVVRRKNFTFYFPVVTMIVLSILITIIFNFLGRK
jgi:hypothetical protein